MQITLEQAIIRDIRYSITKEGDKAGSMVIEFLATDENQDAVNRLQKPDEYIQVTLADGCDQE